MLIEMEFLKKHLIKWHGGFFVMLGREIGYCCFIKLLAYCVRSLACAGKDKLARSSWSHVT